MEGSMRPFDIWLFLYGNEIYALKVGQRDIILIPVFVFYLLCQIINEWSQPMIEYITYVISSRIGWVNSYIVWENR